MRLRKVVSVTQHDVAIKYEFRITPSNSGHPSPCSSTEPEQQVSAPLGFLSCYHGPLTDTFKTFHLRRLADFFHGHFLW